MYAEVSTQAEVEGLSVPQVADGFRSMPSGRQIGFEPEQFCDHQDTSSRPYAVDRRVRLHHGLAHAD